MKYVSVYNPTEMGANTKRNICSMKREIKQMHSFFAPLSCCKLLYKMSQDCWSQACWMDIGRIHSIRYKIAEILASISGLTYLFYDTLPAYAGLQEIRRKGLALSGQNIIQVFNRDDLTGLI